MSNDLDSYDDVAQWDLNLPDGKHCVRYVICTSTTGLYSFVRTVIFLKLHVILHDRLFLSLTRRTNQLASTSILDSLINVELIN